MKTYVDFLNIIEPLLIYFVNNSRFKDNYWELKHVVSGKTLQFNTNSEGMVNDVDFYRSLLGFIYECGYLSGKVSQNAIIKENIDKLLCT